MTAMKIKTSDGLNLYVRDWPCSGSQLPVICLHGLTRNASDFDDMAKVVSEQRRCIAIDFRGRARSDYDPAWHRYIPPVYANDVIEIMEALEVPRAVFCGTSLGGLVTMLIAQRDRSRVAAAILNDIGPVIEASGLARIQAYTGKLEQPNNWDEAREQVKAIYGDGLPGLSDAQFDELCHKTYRETDDGRLDFDYDPNIGRAIREADMKLGDPWELFEALRDIPTLVLRGEHSDILSEQTVDEMASRHDQLQRATIADRAHVPLLNEPDSLSAIGRFLDNCP